MFGKVKRWLGIEGVKLELVIPEEISEKEKGVSGKIQFFSMNTQTVTSIEVKMIERYSRGRKSEKLTDEYVLGLIHLDQEIEVPAEEIIEIDFMLPFKIEKSEMDDIEDRSFLLRGLVKTAKWFSNVKSEFRIEAAAKVRGGALDPFDKKEIIMK